MRNSLLPARSILVLMVLFAAACSSDDGDKVLTGKITKVFPESGAVERFVIIGSNHAFSTAGENVVKFNGVVAKKLGRNKVDSADSLYVMVPAGATTGPITVERNGEVLAGPVFTVIPTQEVDHFVRFKIGDEIKSYLLDDESERVNCGCVCYFSPSYDNPILDLRLCDYGNDEFNSNSGLATLKGKTFPMTDDFAELRGLISLTIDGQIYESHVGSFKVNDVVYVGSFQGDDVYSVSGIFSGTLYNTQTNAVYGEMKEGTFVLPLPVNPFF